LTPTKFQQKAIPLSVISLVTQANTTETQRATSQLIVGAFFFACRSCEYLQVQRPDEKQTKILTIGNVAFYKDDVELQHSTPTLLSSADRVSITFVSQKNGRKNDTITQWRTDHATLCPVIQWAAIVSRIWIYPNTTPSTPVSTVLVRNRIAHITSKHVESALRDGVVAIGEDSLRIQQHEVGTHSIRAGAAMAMYLGGVPVFAIMMIGRWSSMAFMNYIRKQIEEFTLNVSKNMLSMQSFRHTPQASHSPRRTEYGGSASMMLVQNMA
jgi:hypothetical protein